MSFKAHADSTTRPDRYFRCAGAAGQASMIAMARQNHDLRHVDRVGMNVVVGIEDRLFAPGACIHEPVLPNVVILAGGRGTRLQEHTRSIPKPLVEIGGYPIVWHVIQIYRAQGFRRFVLLTGYKSDHIERFVQREQWPSGTDVSCIDTGIDTPTGGRLRRAADAIDGQSFCVTYADAVADIDLAALMATHADHGAQATMTVVRPQLQFGVAQLSSDGVVTGFVEKPRSEHWVNGGFFCFERSVLGLLTDTDMLERQPLERLAATGQLRAFRHDGFWGCMDTYKDSLLLNDYWARGSAPWRLWDPASAPPRSEPIAIQA